MTTQRDHMSLFPRGATIIGGITKVWPDTAYTIGNGAEVFESAVGGIPQDVLDKALKLENLAKYKAPRNAGPLPQEFYEYCLGFMPPRVNANTGAKPVGLWRPDSPIEKTWAAVQNAYQVWLGSASALFAPRAKHLGPKRAIQVVLPLKDADMLTADEIHSIILDAKVPGENNTSIHEHRVFFGALRRTFEDIFEPLGSAPGRTSHAFCACDQCKDEVRQFSRGLVS